MCACIEKADFAAFALSKPEIAIFVQDEAKWSGGSGNTGRVLCPGIAADRQFTNSVVRGIGEPDMAVPIQLQKGGIERAGRGLIGVQQMWLTSLQTEFLDRAIGWIDTDRGRVTVGLCNPGVATAIKNDCPGISNRRYGVDAT